MLSTQAPAATSPTSQRRVIVVVVESHYIATPTGVFTPRGMGHPYAYWQQYLTLFEHVCTIARARWSPYPDPTWQRVDGPGVRVIRVPDHAGIGQIARMLPRSWPIIARGLTMGDYFFLRGGGPMGTLAWLQLRARGIPYGRQVVGHDRESLGTALGHLAAPVRRAVAAIGHGLARLQVHGAACVAYVSPALASSYPAAPGVPVFHFSDVVLGPDIMTGPRAAAEFCATPLRLVSVGRLNPEKGHRVLVEALADLDRHGARSWTLDLIGPGPETEALRALATARGLADRVRLLGFVPRGPELFARLDASDLLVLPSLTEGLPRGMLEALSRGLPAVGTRVGGVPDLLDAAAMAPAGDPVRLAQCIRPYMGAPHRLAAASRQGFRRVMDWHPDRMNAHKQSFWRTLRDRTDAWREAVESPTTRQPYYAAVQAASRVGDC